MMCLTKQFIHSLRLLVLLQGQVVHVDPELTKIFTIVNVCDIIVANNK